MSRFARLTVGLLPLVRSEFEHLVPQYHIRLAGGLKGNLKLRRIRSSDLQFLLPENARWQTGRMRWRMGILGLALLLAPSSLMAVDERTSGWEQVFPRPTEKTLYSVVAGNGWLVAVGEGGTVLSSTDGVVWRSQNSGTQTLLWKAAFGGGLFVAVGQEGRVITSATGTTWKSADAGVSEDLFVVAYAGDRFIAGGSDGAILTSQDATAWTRQHSGVSARLLSVAFGNGRFVMVGSDGTIVTSDDGTQWTLRESGVSTWLRAVIFDGHRYNALGDEGVIINSADGEEWSRAPSHLDADFHAVARVKGQTVAVGFSGAVASSSDGLAWAPQDSGTLEALYGVVYAGTQLAAVGADGTILISRDARGWARSGTGGAGNVLTIVPGDKFLLAGGEGGVVLSSSDGKSWGEISFDSTSAVLDGAYGGGEFRLLTADGTIWSSTDGTNWTPTQPENSPSLSAVCFGKDLFVAVGEQGTILSSSAAGTWTQQTSPTLATLVDVDFGGQFVAVGDTGIILTSPDGVAWTLRESSTESLLQGVARGTDRFIVVGADGVILHSHDGEQWARVEQESLLPLYTVASRGQRFLASGAQGTLLISQNGTEWGPGQPVTDNGIVKLIAHRSRFVAAALRGGIFLSDELIENEAPVLGTLPDVLIVEELTPLSLSVTASDPSDGLRFSLGPDAPPGAQIDPESGTLTWVPTEIQGPGTNIIVVKVTDNGTPPLSDSRSLTIVVTEQNTAPVLEPIADRIILPGMTLRIATEASDPDVPQNTLSYQIAQGRKGMTIDGATKDFMWRPSESTFPGLVTVVLRVVDEGGLSASQEFQIVLRTSNQIPFARNQTLTTGRNTARPFVLTCFDADGDPFSYEIVALPTHGKLEGIAPDLTYVPDADFTGSDSLTFLVSDGLAESNVGTISFLVTAEAEAPSISLSRTNLTYTEQSGPVLIDAEALVRASQDAEFENGVLRVELQEGNQAEDRLTIMHEGSGPGQIGVSGDQVTYEDRLMALFSGSQDGTQPLVVTFNSQANIEGIQALLRRVAYENASSDPSLAHRVLSVTLSESTGMLSSPATLALVVIPVSENPTIDWNSPTDIVYGVGLGDEQLNAEANVPGTFLYDPPAGSLLNAGAGQVLTLTFVPEDTTNYNAVSAEVAINVLRAPLRITADSKTKKYGEAVLLLTASYSGFRNNETDAVLEIPPTITTTAVSASDVGTYLITCSGANALNYDITFAEGTFTITPAVLAIKADDKSRPEGTENPPLTATYEGLVNGDSPADLDTPVVLRTPAELDSPSGDYPILVDGATDANYDITFENGVLTITTPELISLQIEPSEVTLRVGQSQQFFATGLYSDGATSEDQPGVTWESSAPSVLSITSDGFAEAKKAGNVQIRAEVHGKKDTLDLIIGEESGGAAAFFNNTPILVPDHGPSALYPSEIVVSGLEGSLSTVTVTLHGITHGWPDDLDVLLVAPGNRKVFLFSDAGESNRLDNVTITLSDAAPDSLPDSTAIGSGTYRPAHHGTGGDLFPIPAPEEPYDVSLASLSGLDPNGAWLLFVVDDEEDDQGSIAGGWSISLTTTDGGSVGSRLVGRQALASAERRPANDTEDFHIGSIEVLVPGTIYLRIRPSADQSCLLQRSPDLKDWQTIHSFLPSAHPYDFLDSNAFSQSRLFYRLVRQSHRE